MPPTSYSYIVVLHRSPLFISVPFILLMEEFANIFIFSSSELSVLVLSPACHFSCYIYTYIYTVDPAEHGGYIP